MLTGHILVVLVVVILIVQVFGFLCHHIGQQWVIGEILAGLVLGPSLLGLLAPGIEAQLLPTTILPTIQTIGDIGLALYMFSLGTRLDIQHMKKQSRKAIVVSLSGMIFPLILGVILGSLLYPVLAGTQASPLSLSLFVGTAMAITAFPVLARLLSEKKMLGTQIGVLALTSASIDDVMAWCLLALVIAIAHNQGISAFFWSIGLTLVFIAVMFLIIRPLLIVVARRKFFEGSLTAVVMLVLLAAAAVTNAIGIHPIFGAFLAGIIMPRQAVFTRQVRNLDTINSILFLPLFFIFSGLQTQIGLLNSPLLWSFCLLTIGVACMGKLFGCMIAARLTKSSWHDAFGIGILMNTRGLVELIVLNIGLQLKVLSPALFSMLVVMALVTTMMASPLLYLLGYRTPKEDVVVTSEAESEATSVAT